MFCGSDLSATRLSWRDICCSIPAISTAVGACGGIAVATIMGTTILRNSVVILCVPLGAAIGYSGGVIAETVRLNKMRSDIEQAIELLGK